jgi:Holliday junction resolvase RusA-like endonuclease
MKFTLPFPPAILNPNHKKHWAVKARAFKKYKNHCLIMLAAQKPALNLKFSITFHPPTKHKRDRDNIISAFKAGQDALAHYWGVDDSEFIIQYMPLGEPVKGGAVVIED